MGKTDKVIYTKEEISERVRVAPVVEADLKRIITDRMEQCGLYFRAFSRTKTAASMARKFEQKEYCGDRKLQDLVGVRINLYFDDDVEICQYILDQTFEVVNWSTSERTADEFKPQKVNGVFRLPEYLKNEISPDTWDMCIDDTFEVQIKTMFFEGWHEIEHDMRYKGEELWLDYQGFSRYLNSILATLELCDKSMVTLFENLGHELYKSGRWSDMIKSHFHVKMGDVPMYPELQKLLDDEQSSPGNLAKRIYKTDRLVLVDQLLKRSRRVPINVNTIIALLNEASFHDGRLTAIFRRHDVYNDGREETLAESRHYELRPLIRQTVFQMCTQVDGSRMKNADTVTGREIFDACTNVIYQWVVKKYGHLMKNMPEEPSTYQAAILAYEVSISLDGEKGRMNTHVSHIDQDVGGRVWYSDASLTLDEEQKVMLRVSNGYAEPAQDDRPIHEGLGSFFSYPGYYKTIVDTIGIFNAIPCSNKRRIITEDWFPELEEALKNRDRKFPIVIIISKEDEDGMMDEDWLGQFRVSDFTRTVWRYTHVLTCYAEVGVKLQERLRQMGCFRVDNDLAFDATDFPRLYIFWPEGNVDDFGPEDVENCTVGRHLEVRSDTRTYDIVRGGQALYHKILTELRDWNVSADMWEGFHRETATRIPT